MKLIGLDYGTRRIGVAVTDDSGEFIRSLPTLDRKKGTLSVEAIAALIKQENPEKIIIGLPLDKDDRDTAMSLEIRKFAATLERLTSLPVHFIDESLTSRRANVIIRNRRMKQRRNKGNIDRIAACLILEEYKKENQ
jgi:putative Holliday junction resolvase